MCNGGVWYKVAGNAEECLATTGCWEELPELVRLSCVDRELAGDGSSDSTSLFSSFCFCSVVRFSFLFFLPFF